MKAKICSVLMLIHCGCGLASNDSSELQKLKKENQLLRHQTNHEVTPIITDDQTSASEIKYHRLETFVDNTSAFKSKVLITIARFDAHLRGYTLRDKIGFDADFFAYGANGNNDLVIAIPKGLSVPNAGDVEELTIEFECTKGKLMDGNIARKITRYANEYSEGFVYEIK